MKKLAIFIMMLILVTASNASALLINADTVNSIESLEKFTGSFNYRFSSTTDFSWLGSGGTTSGISIGDTGTFRFDRTGAILDALRKYGFIDKLTTWGSGGTFWYGKHTLPPLPDGNSDSTPIPEPSTLILLSTGIAGFLATRARRKL